MHLPWDILAFLEEIMILFILVGKLKYILSIPNHKSAINNPGIL